MPKKVINWVLIWKRWNSFNHLLVCFVGFFLQKQLLIQISADTMCLCKKYVSFSSTEPVAFLLQVEDCCANSLFTKYVFRTHALSQIYSNLEALLLVFLKSSPSF